MNCLTFYNRIRTCFAMLCRFLFTVAVLGWITGSLAAEPRRGMVASVHPLATEAGLETLRHGGNAIDAAVAVALTLGVVDGANSGIGGGCFMLIRRADGSFVCLDGREMAPSEATREMFIRAGKGDTALSQTGALASGVPGALAAYEYAVTHFGNKKLKDLLLPAAALADKGFVVSSSYAQRIRGVADEMAPFEFSKAIFFKGGKPLATGDLLRQTDLARTYRAIAKEGSGWFYRGPFARLTEQWMQTHGGIMTAKDFENYQVRLREPVMTSYRGYEIVGFPPPSSGGVHVAQILNILENFKLAGCNEGTRDHLIAEAMKLAFADRAYWLGDPDFTKVPRGLLDKQYAKTLAGKINPATVTKISSHGEPPNSQTDLFKKHTTHFSVADDAGNWVACTATVNTGFGSKVVIPGTGVIMNDEMDDFSIQPGVKNFFGLVGADANAVEPGKRPLSSMSPTIVLKEGKPIIALGAAGGPKIISAVALELISMLDLGLSPAEALKQPRIHQQWSPDELMVEAALPKSVQTSLVSRGHKLTVLSSMAVSQIVFRSSDGVFHAAADPRAGGTVAGW
jgi:gamma-glutamyltranspeptidase/glutathione hydrolase